MTLQTRHRGRRLAGAALLATALAITPAATAAAAPPKPSAPTSKCKPGEIKKKKDAKGKEYVWVCDTKGKWTEVHMIVANSSGGPAQTGATDATATRALKPKVDPKPGRCMVAGGVYIDAGEVIVETSYVRDENGTTVSITHHTLLCTANGTLVEVFAIKALPPTATPAPGQTPEKTR